VLVAAGIAKSSVALSVASLLCAVGAGTLLFAASAAYRRLHPAEAPALVATPQGAGAPPAGNGGGPQQPTVPDGFAELNATDAARVADTLNLDELHALRRYEIEHEDRKTVLRAVDRRVESIMEVRRQLAGQT